MFLMLKVLCSSASQCPEICTSSVIKSPPSMWKKASIQWGMGIVSSQVCVIGSGTVDRFCETILVEAMSGPCIWKG